MQDSGRKSVEIPTRRVWVAVVPADAPEADVLRQELAVYPASLATYARPEDLVMNPPVGRLAMVVLASAPDAGSVQRVLDWIRRRCPRCVMAIVGEAGSGSLEMTARSYGALYFTRPVGREQLSGLLESIQQQLSTGIEPQVRQPS